MCRWRSKLTVIFAHVFLLKLNKSIELHLHRQLVTMHEQYANINNYFVNSALSRRSTRSCMMLGPRSDLGLIYSSGINGEHSIPEGAPILIHW